MRPEVATSSPYGVPDPRSTDVVPDTSKVTAAGGTRVRYRTVLANREYLGLFTAYSLSLLGDQLARIALALLVFRRTGSTFQASATYGVSYLAYLAGGPLLSGLADRFRRLPVMVVCDLIRVPLVLSLCVTDLPLPLVFVLIAGLGAVAPAFDSARAATLPDVLAGDAYPVGSGLMSLAGQLSQVLGFALGGALVAVTSVRGALALDAATFLLSAACLLLAVGNRPVVRDPNGAPRPGLFGGARAAAGLVVRTMALRRLLALSLAASIAVTATEGLAVPVAGSVGGNAALAGLLTATIPLGFLLASPFVLRLRSAQRDRALVALVLAACLPLLLTPVLGTATALLVTWTVAGVGGTTNLIAGPAFVVRLPEARRAQAYGVAGTVLQGGQGLGLLVAGLLGDLLGARTATAAVALGCLALAVPFLDPQGNGHSGR